MRQYIDENCVSKFCNCQNIDGKKRQMIDKKNVIFFCAFFLAYIVTFD